MGLSRVLAGRAGLRAAAPTSMLVVAAAFALSTQAARAQEPDLFRKANELALAGDHPKAIALYAELAASGRESPSLYWNWAQSAQARGALGEALWALLRSRELDPSDRALARDIERLREAASLDAAEIAPDPLSAVSRTSRRYRLDLAAAVLLALSLVFHAVHRAMPERRGVAAAAIAALAIGLMLAVAPLVGAFARPLAVVVARGASLTDAASADARPIGTLREGEVVPVLGESTGFMRIEDSSGARGWARQEDVRRLDKAP
jgi:hypothetical protein